MLQPEDPLARHASDMSSAARLQMIIVTPEKWDIITRKSGDRTYTQKVLLPEAAPCTCPHRFTSHAHGSMKCWRTPAADMFAVLAV